MSTIPSIITTEQEQLLAILKGTRIGGALVSPKHANFIVNDGEATAADLEQLIHRVRDSVVQRFGIRLDTEVRIVGEAA